MAHPFRLPDLGEGIHEAEILSIQVEEGQRVEEGDIIGEVETDKAAVELPSPVSGTIETIAVRPGDTVKVGELIVSFSLAEGPDTKPAARDAGERKLPAEPGEKGRKRSPVPAAPSTRRIARELGVDLHQITPSGPGGRVTADDVHKHAEQAGEPQYVSNEKEDETESVSGDVEFGTGSLPDFSRWGEIERIPFRSIRRATANRMTASWNQIPHVNCQDVADVTALESFRQRHRQEIEEAGGRLTMTVFAFKAVATALKKFPYFNATLDVDAQEIILKKYFHIGIAADTSQGLLVPVLHDVDRKSIREIAVEMHQCLERARARKSAREELRGSTFTITNAGAIGGGFFSAIINYPESAILGLGQARRQPAVVSNDQGGEEIAVRLLMPVVLCFDHRVADGADAIRFQRMIIDMLEDPDELLMSMI